MHPLLKRSLLFVGAIIVVLALLTGELDWRQLRRAELTCSTSVNNT